MKPKSGIILDLILFSTFISYTTAASLAPAFFIFGDSLVDPGNNNWVPVTLAKANYQFNGIDYPSGATGRFCNGRTIFDVLSDLIAVPYPPPYLAPTTFGSSILRGVNYASGAGGILDGTGANYIERISFNQQLKYFEKTVAQLKFLLGPERAERLVSSSFFAVIIGSNDYINNYLLSDSATRSRYTPEAYGQLLVDAISSNLEKIYELGARKILVTGVGPIGCIPNQLAQANTDGRCIESINHMIIDYNVKLKRLLQAFNTNLPGAMFLYGNAYDVVLQLIDNAASKGFTNANEGCCGGGKYNGQIPCNPTSSLCRDRDEYIFWDPWHPTEAANIIFAQRLFSGGLTDVFPQNVQNLLQGH